MAKASVLGCLLLVHAAYSAYEHHHHFRHVTAVPRDIWLELLVALVLLNIGAIQGLANEDRLALISGERQAPPKKYLRPIEISAAMQSRNSLQVTEHQTLDLRVDFFNVTAKRKEYLEWKQLLGQT